MPAAVYPLLLLLVVYVLGVAFFKSELFGHFLLLGFAMALMMVITHYVQLYVWGLAYQARLPLAALLARPQRHHRRLDRSGPHPWPGLGSPQKTEIIAR